MRVFLVALLLATVVRGQDNPYASLLKQRGIGSDRESLAAFLRTCIPTEQTPRLIDALVDELGGGDAASREQAVRRLADMPFLAAKAARAATQRDDPEVRRLAVRVVEAHRRSRYQELLNAVFHTIRFEQVDGLVELLLEALPHCEEGYLLYPAQLALVSTSTPGDVGVLTDALKRGEPAVRAAAIRALGKVEQRRAIARIRPLLKDGDETVRLVAAETLTALGARDGLTTLGELLLSEDAQVRFRAAAILRAVTNRRFGFVSYETAEKRLGAADRWRTFLAEHRHSVALHLPLRVRPEFQGRTLVCSINSKRLEEYDRAGRKIFQSPQLAVPWGCAGLGNGHRLVAVFSARLVIEYDRSGREVWRTGVLPGPPMSVQRLAGGNTLVACSDTGKVIEISPAGHTVWSVTLQGRPIDARRLQNGRTLVTLYQVRRVVEVDRNGAIVWQLRGRGTPSTAQRLENGNTLVAGMEQHNSVTEYTPDGKVAWRVAGLSTVYDAQRLPNGNTLVGTSNGAREYDRTGKLVWRKDVGPCRVTRY